MRYVVLGGGIAGVSCYLELCRVCVKGDVIILVSASDAVQRARNVSCAGSAREAFDVSRESLFNVGAAGLAAGAAAGVTALTIRCIAERIDSDACRVLLRECESGGGVVVESESGASLRADGLVWLPFDRVCVATGAAPRHLLGNPHPLVYAPRDAAGIGALGAALRGARRVMIYGNGGIALGLWSEAPAIAAEGTELLWVAREDFVGATLLTPAAAAFLLNETADVSQLPEPDAWAGRGGQGKGVGSADTSTLTPDNDDEAVLLAAALEAGFIHGDKGGGKGLREGKGKGEFTAAATLVPCTAVVQALPRREGSRKRKRAPLLPPQPLPPLSEVLTAAAVVDSSPQPRSDDAAVTVAAAVASSSSSAPPLGAAMGSHWAAALRGGADTAASVGGGRARPRIALVTGLEVVAVRGQVGTAGASGDLADGAWHTVLELCLSAKSASPSASAAAGTESEKAGPEAGAVAELEAEAEAEAEADAEAGAKVGAGVGAEAVAVEAAQTWPLYVRLSDGREYGVDVLVSPIGVEPVTKAVARDDATRSADGGLIVNARMQTSGGGGRIFAAGDVATVLWPRALAAARGVPLLWHQKRTWSQALASGLHAARCMAGAVDALEAADGGVAFELFHHQTQVAGRRVALLGAVGGTGGSGGWGGGGGAQALARAVERDAKDHQGEVGQGGQSEGGQKDISAILVRAAPGDSFAQVLVLDGAVVGALLVGDTGLDETMENLMLNRTKCVGADGQLLDLLNADVDVDDFFD